MIASRYLIYGCLIPHLHLCLFLNMLLVKFHKSCWCWCVQAEVSHHHNLRFPRDRPWDHTYFINRKSLIKMSPKSVFMLMSLRCAGVLWNKLSLMSRFFCVILHFEWRSESAVPPFITFQGFEMSQYLRTNISDQWFFTKFKKKRLKLKLFYLSLRIRAHISFKPKQSHRRGQKFITNI